MTLRELIADGRTHVFDGAMGTMLYDRGVFLNVCYDELNLRQPDLVRDIHREYVRAGAELIETNTFGANPRKLTQFGLAAETERINQAAAELARQAAGPRAAVVGAIGPLGLRIEPFGETSIAEAQADFARQVEGLLRGGVDGFVLETFSDVEELRAAFAAIRRRLRPAGDRADDGRHRRTHPLRHRARQSSVRCWRRWAPTSSE